MMHSILEEIGLVVILINPTSPRVFGGATSMSTSSPGSKASFWANWKLKQTFVYVALGTVIFTDTGELAVRTKLVGFVLACCAALAGIGRATRPRTDVRMARYVHRTQDRFLVDGILLSSSLTSAHSYLDICVIPQRLYSKQQTTVATTSCCRS